jgi:hypothetical protein
MAKDDDLD